MNLTQLEQEVVWLTKRVLANEDLIKRAEAYFKENQSQWSRGVFEYFYDSLERMKDQLYYEQNRLEILAWKVIMERERNSN